MPTVNLTLTGQALSKVDDTNVTLTLGGTPLTALLRATSITVGWTGQLSVARGGTGLGALGTANQLLRVNALGTALEYFTPTYGTGTVTSVSVVSANGFAGTVANATTTPAITLSTSINSPVLAGNGTALIAATTTGSGSTVVLSTSPTFVTDISAPKIISSTASGGLLLCNNNGGTVASFGVGSAGSTNIALIGATTVTGTISGTSSLTLGTASTTVGSIVLNNATNANTITIQSGVTSASYSLTLPTAQGSANTVLTNNGSGVLSWTAPSSGITVGTTTITSGTNTRIPFNDNGVYGEDAGLTYNKNTDILNTTGGFNVNSYKALRIQGTGDGSGTTTVVGNSGIGGSVGGDYNTVVGQTAYWGLSGTKNTLVGQGGFGGTTSYSTFIGAEATGITANNSQLAIGYQATTTSANQCVIGAAAAPSGNGVYNNLYFNGVTHSSASPIIINACGGSGTNNAGASLTFAGGKSTGSAAGGSLVFKTSTTLGSGTTAQSLVTRLTLSGGAVTTDASTATWADALDFVFGSTTGTKIGTATTQKIGFWNATPIVQVTTAVGSATLASPGAGTSIKSDDTFDGYTLQQVVKALRNLGLLA